MSLPLSSLFALFILLLPGLAWLVWFERKGDFTSRLADVIGLSLALPAIIGLGTFLFGWRFSGMGVVWVYGLVGLIIVVSLIRWRRKTSISHPSTILRTSSQFPITNYQLLITNSLPILLFALLLAFRFYQSRNLALPAWVDSVHHTLVVRLFLETGGIPPTMEPYIQAPFYYHFGFHLNAALFAFLSRLSPEQAILIFGQFLNAFVSLAMYRLGMALWNDWRRAGIAMLLTGFVFQMPAYYLTWGRYTLLTGLGLLILAMAATLDVIRSSNDREPAVRLAIYTAGVLITHYFAAGLLALFFVAVVLEQIVFGEVPWQLWKHKGFRMIFFAGLAGFLLAAPWVWHVWDSGNQYFGVNVVAPTDSPDEVYFSGYLEHLWNLLGPYRSHVMLFLGLTSLLLVGWRDRTRPFGVWAVAFGILSLPWGVHIAPFRPDYGVIIVFFPAGMLIADAFVTPLDTGSRAGFHWLARGALTTALISLLVWGVRETRDVVNPVTILANQAEVNALDWIEQNTPEEANFFINVTYWQSDSYRGVDGGWWIMPLTGRSTFLPPALYLLGDQEDVIAINALSERASQFKACSAEFQTFLKETAITHVYLGPSQGSLRPDTLGDCPGLSIVYQNEGVTIYEVDAG
jgi:hypothetical protein